ncbi:MAG: UDP-N-acetylglucosamine 1-carboxyvinyltransferase [Patescibacteria group bacterium]
MHSDSQVLDYIRVEGGRPLTGEIVLKGAKNTVPKNMVAAVLTDEHCRLENTPEIEDVEIITKIIELLGGVVTNDKETDVITIEAKNIKTPKPKDLVSYTGKSRIPILFAGPLLARLGEAIIPMPGGCDIGSRPVDFHIQALEKLGATVEAKGDYYLVKADKLVGTKIALDYPSVGATEQVLLASVMAEGTTELTGAAVEPEVIDLISVLQRMGAIISVDTDRVMTIVGVSKLRGYIHEAMPDRNEASSWACAAAATGGRIFVRGAKQLDMMTFLNKFRQVGGEFDINEQGITFYRSGPLKSISMETAVHPGFMTDWQQPFVVMLTQAHGASIVHETVYENRFGYVEALNNMGAKIQLYNKCLGGNDCRYSGTNYLHSAVITGPTPLTGTEIVVPDLRGGFSYVIAALVANGESKITQMAIINRGYEHIVDKLKALGAKILEVKTV